MLCFQNVFFFFGWQQFSEGFEISKRRKKGNRKEMQGKETSNTTSRLNKFNKSYSAFFQISVVSRIEFYKLKKQKKLPFLVCLLLSHPVERKYKNRFTNRNIGFIVATKNILRLNFFLQLTVSHRYIKIDIILVKRRKICEPFFDHRYILLLQIF